MRGAGTEAITAGLRAATSRRSCWRSGWPRSCRVLILDEPTRGVDVGAKAEIHALIDRLAAAGSAVLLISSELPELIGLSTRILVMRAGTMAGELPRARADQATVMRLMAGIESVTAN